ncbi:related to Zn(II)2Cys6 transcriptional activator [Rhynchosporium agropyri]|uniref:Related to Zn(II)2Cys6 transcriptional activator n=1 Tax=Rhynchosporium agropyri TaxID=914238 RepID=A0A1E1K5C9_9HELO|nr:related to Zn(II)2Cys6 transcriptional activator [Rhynchosporium agropyri]
MATVLCEPASMFEFVLVNQSWASIQPTIASPDIDLRRRCTEAFFRYFYDAHPFLLPRQRYLETSKEGPPREHLETAVAYIGSRYVKGAPQSAFSLELDCFVLQHNLPRNVSTVQAMLLFAIGLDGNNEGKKAVEVLIKAQRFALDLGMNQREYAVINGGGAFLREESIRRTWWELYVVSVIVAALHGNRVFQLSGVISTTPLPCGTDDFANGVTPQLYTIEEFDEHSFLDPEVEWSSCAYRIAAARNLKRILETDSLVFLDDALICILDTILVNWNLHLPLSKVASYDQSGTFDEMIFQAHMITELSSLLLHRRFISLDATATQNIVSCTPQGTVQAYCSGSNNIHTSKATQAASNISKLVGMPTPLINHTQFLIRALTHSSISHVSLWSHLPLLAADENLKEEIRMNAGALREMGMVWPAAQMAYSQVTNAAAKVFESRRDAVGNAFGRDLIGSEIIDASLDLDCFTIGITDVNP